MTASHALGQVASVEHNLPAEVASFVGRERELADATDTLLRAKLLTLTGVGGCGKTQLALRVAADLVPRFPDGVWLVELAPLMDSAQVARAVAVAVGVGGRSERRIIDLLVGALATSRVLLVLASSGDRRRTSTPGYKATPSSSCAVAISANSPAAANGVAVQTRRPEPSGGHDVLDEHRDPVM